jgi:hypothetical protein
LRKPRLQELCAGHAALEQIIADEGLNADTTKVFVDNAFLGGLSTSVPLKTAA